MAQNHRHITQKHPETGADPHRQSAEAIQNQKPQQQEVPQTEKLLHQLVENTISYAGEQFGDNLKYNQKVLADVLYDNLFDLLSNKLNEDSFVSGLVDDLIANGCVVRSGSPSGQSSTPSADQVVNVVSEEDYQELYSKVQASVDLVKANRVNVFKVFSDIDGSIRDISGLGVVRGNDDERGKQIDGLSEQIRTSAESMDEHVQESQETRKQIEDRLDEISASMRECLEQRRKSSQYNQTISEKIKGIFKKIGERNKEQDKSSSKILPSGKGIFGAPPKSSDGSGVVGWLFGKNQAKKFQEQIGKNAAKGKGKTPASPLFQSAKIKKKPSSPGYMSRIKMKLTNVKNRVKNRISNSVLGRGYRKVKAAVGKVWSGIKAVARTIKKVVVATVKTAAKAAKTFYKASKFVGNTLRSGLRLAVRGVKSIRATIKAEGFKGLGQKIANFAPAQIITKIGWRAMKWAGKKLWTGMKKLAGMGLSLLKKMFVIALGFVGKVSMWVGRIGKGIVKKAYRFMIKPIATIITTVFKFVAGVVMSPIRFIGWFIPMIFEKVRTMLHNIAQGVKRCVKLVTSTFMRIIKNPITIGLLIGGLAALLIYKLTDWLNGGLKTIKTTVIPMIVSFATSVFEFLKGAWSVISTVGVFMFKAVAYLTNPKGIIANTIRFLVDTYLMLKGYMKRIMKIAGKNSLDALCMFIAGDYLGIAIAMIGGWVKIAWNYVKQMKLFRLFLGYIKVLAGIGVLISGLVPTLLASIGSAVWQGAKQAFSILRGKLPDFSKVVDAFCRPWKTYWGIAKKLFKGAVSDLNTVVSPAKDNEILLDDPTESNVQKAADTKIAVRNLGMKGMNSEKNIKWMNSLHQSGAASSIVDRINVMNDIYQDNSDRVKKYADFIASLWEEGKISDETAQTMLTTLLESPDLSQKLLSAFFYHDPGTGNTMMLRPASYIGQFIDNIRKMMADPDRDNHKSFRTIIEAFDQLNKERSHIINQQGDLIKEVSEKIANLSMDKAEDAKVLKEIADDINSNNLFKKNMDVKSSFKQMQNDNAKTQDIKSVTGSDLGNNDLLKVEPLTTSASGGSAPLKDSDFVAKPPPPPKPNEFGTVTLPAAMAPAAIPNPNTSGAERDTQNLAKLWKEHLKKRSALMNQGMGSKELDQKGLKNYTFDEFKALYSKKHPPSEEELKKWQENRQKRLIALRLAKNIQTFNNQGVVANVDGFQLGSKPAILKVETDNLSQMMYMFSPEWQRVQGSSKLSDAELRLELDAADEKAAQEVKKQKEQELAKQREEEARKKREQEILDYSAKVSGGFIEVKIGEDVTAMMNAWREHLKKRSQMMNKGVGSKELDKMGLINYTWDEWKKYYRRMHGLPEDGIRRIPFEGKKKERKIDWSARNPLSPDELKKYGIEASTEGPVMIPLEKAMAATSDLLNGAKTIYAIRDGLEVMSQGLKTEAGQLKKRREEGIPAAVVQTGDSSSGYAPAPPDQSHYAQVG